MQVLRSSSCCRCLCRCALKLLYSMNLILSSPLSAAATFSTASHRSLHSRSSGPSAAGLATPQPDTGQTPPGQNSSSSSLDSSPSGTDADQQAVSGSVGPPLDYDAAVHTLCWPVASQTDSVSASPQPDRAPSGWSGATGAPKQRPELGKGVQGPIETVPVQHGHVGAVGFGGKKKVLSLF